MSSHFVHIHRSRSLLAVDWVELWRYRDLLAQMVLRDFTARYKQTLLGPLWFLFQPLATSLIFTVVFAGVVQVPTDGVPAPLFYLTGLLLWNYFQTALNSVSGCLRANAGIVSKVYFPRLILPLTATCSALFGLAIQLVVWAIAMVGARVGGGGGMETLAPQWSALLLPLLVLQTGLLAIGAGLLLASATAKYRDLSQAVGFFLQAWMYLTPVIYPMSRIPEGWRWLAAINPMSFPVEASRWMLLGQGSPDLTMGLVAVATTGAILLAGLICFTRVERTFVDII